MAFRILINRLRAWLQAFRTANSGNVMITFALATVPVIGFVGAAVDYSRANSDKAAMQAAIDATALMLSKNASTLTVAQMTTKATDYFMAQFHRTDVHNIVITPTYTASNGYQIVLTATGTVPTTFTKIVGLTTMNIDVTSTVKWGNTRLRVALVLDNTGSMSQSGKLTALKTATTNLLTQLQNAAAQPGDVYVSIIPFVKDVSVDPVSNNTQSWIDWGRVPTNVNSPGTGTGWEGDPPLINNDIRSSANIDNWMQIGPNSNCPFPSNNSNSTYGFTCTDRPATDSQASTTNKIPNSGSYKGYICPSIDNGNQNSQKANIYYNGCYDSSKYSSGPSSSASCTDAQGVVHKHCSCTGSGSGKVCSTNSNYYEHVWRQPVTAAGQVTAAPPHSTWNGCFTDRGDTATPNAGNYDANVAAPIVGTPATLFPAEQYNSCPQTMMPLNYSWSTMTTQVNNMVANGNTNQAIGLAHGWLSLVGGGPFPTPPAMDPLYQYSKVIILLTDGLNTEDRWYTDQTSIDNRQKITCDNIYAAGITLYTVQVNTGGDPTSTLLQNCAGTPNNDPAKAKYPDPSKFFLLTSSSEIITTFNQIGTALSNLRVAK
jgi:Flp pilus assembly protein TadG